MVAVCNKIKVLKTIRLMAETINNHQAYLTDLDAKIGDADHGINLSRGFEAVSLKLPEVESQCVGTILKTIGMVLVASVGGASGPLYGTAFIAAGNSAIGKEELTSAEIGLIFKACLEGIIKRGHAEVGDKTMVDTLAPVVRYLNSPEIEAGINWERVAAIAGEGMESTKKLIALKGRASFLKERSIGHLDPGAVSCYLLIKAIVDQCKSGGN